MTNSFRRIAVSAALVTCVCSAAVADTYRVGPAERHKRVSTITARLRPGDVVEITGDITDSFTLSADGYAGRPITIRGITRIEEWRVVRPHRAPAAPLPARFRRWSSGAAPGQSPKIPTRQRALRD